MIFPFYQRDLHSSSYAASCVHDTWPVDSFACDPFQIKLLSLDSHLSVSDLHSLVPEDKWLLMLFNCSQSPLGLTLKLNGAMVNSYIPFFAAEPSHADRQTFTVISCF